MSLWSYANPARFMGFTAKLLTPLCVLTAAALVIGLGWGFFGTPDTDLGTAVRTFREVADELLPPGYRVETEGQAEEMEKTGGAVMFLMVTGLLMVYMVLASQFNSFLQPVLVMLAQPLAIVGGFMALWLAGHTLNIYSMIGMVLLVGLVLRV